MPFITPDMQVEAIFGPIFGNLTGVILQTAPLAVLGAGPEPVHQMRVATRRLRSAFGLFGKIVDCPQAAALKAGARALAAVLGPPRDWDVFLAGTGADLTAALPNDDAVARLLGAASHQQQIAYASLRRYLDGPAFRKLGAQLAVFAAQHAGSQGSPATVPDFAAFAARILKKRHKRLRASGEGPDGAGIATLTVPELHNCRLQAKRLRYIAEFLAPAFPAHAIARYLRRLSDLQEALGHSNDASVAADLMAQLGRAGGRGYGGGLVRGFVAGRAGNYHDDIASAWRRFRKLDGAALFSAAKPVDLDKD
ncbi:MAG: CHAD domain-containing protein [Acetobacteraceae bacterium]|nr:CHAD domain-containing protein [Acetobacteraceae bacterium]